MYSIKAASQLTGLSVEIIRAWERRYNAVIPQRDHNQRRVYSNNEVKRLHQLKKATDYGHAISKVVELNSEELQALIDHNLSQQEVENVNEKLLLKLFDCVENYDIVGCDNVLGIAMRTMSPLELIQDFLSPALIEIGNRWHRGETSIANERILSSGVRRLLISMMQTYQKTDTSKSLVFGTLSGEMHEIGSLFCAFITASLGYNCYYLGPDLPAEDFVRIANKTHVNAILISMLTLTEQCNNGELLDYICQKRNKKTQIWVGGYGALSLAKQQKLPDDCVLINDISDFQEKLIKL